MEKIVVQSSKASVPNWPISQGIKVGDFVFLSGQTSRNPQREVVGAGDIRAQTRQVIESMKVLLEAAGTSLDNIVKVTHYVTDLEGQRVGFERCGESTSRRPSGQHYDRDRGPGSPGPAYRDREHRRHPKA